MGLKRITLTNDRGGDPEWNQVQATLYTETPLSILEEEDGVLKLLRTKFLAVVEDGEGPQEPLWKGKTK